MLKANICRVYTLNQMCGVFLHMAKDVLKVEIVFVATAKGSNSLFSVSLLEVVGATFLLV